MLGINMYHNVSNNLVLKFGPKAVMTKKVYPHLLDLLLYNKQIKKCYIKR